MITHFLFRLLLRYIAKADPKTTATRVNPLEDSPGTVTIDVITIVVPDITVWMSVVSAVTSVVVVGAEIQWTFNQE